MTSRMGGTLGQTFRNLGQPFRRFGRWLAEGEPIRLPSLRVGPAASRVAGGLKPLRDLAARAVTATGRLAALVGRFLKPAGRFLAPVLRFVRPVGRLLGPLFAPVGRLLAPLVVPIKGLVQPSRRTARPLGSLWVRFGFSAQMAYHGVLAKPLRSCLTILGVAIGVASVVSLMGVGEGARQAILKQFMSLGSNVVVIRSEDPKIAFRPEDADELVERVHTLTMATPVVETKAPLRWRRTRGEAQIVGVNEKFPDIRDHPVVSGHFFTEWHVVQRSPVAVLGYDLAASLMGGRSPVGQTFTMSGRTFRIVGVLARKGAGNGNGIDNKVIIPYTTALQIAERRTVTEIWAKATSAKDADLAVVQLGRIFKRKLGLDQSAPTPVPPGEDGPGGAPGKEPMPEPRPPGDTLPAFSSGKTLVTITNLNSLVKEADKANQVMTLLLGGIAAVSLLVGGLGIMNIMLVAVTERTAEIGVRRALGAKQGDLLTQFLLEALLLSGVGAIAGVAMGIWGAGLFERWGLETAVSLTAIKIAVGVALGTGLLFGVYPAYAASSVPPVEALRR